MFVLLFFFSHEHLKAVCVRARGCVDVFDLRFSDELTVRLLD